MRLLAVALSGGGAKGAAHVGALLELEKMGIKFDIVVGTSIGALVGAGYAILGNSNLLYEYALRLQKAPFIKKAPTSRKIPSILTCIGANLLPSTLPSFLYFYILKKVFKDITFEDLKIKFYCTAVKMESEALVIFNEGPLFPALKASMAMPGAFRPVKINGSKYIDGGTLEKLPILTAKKVGADKIIALKLLSKKIKYEEIKNASQAFDRMDSIRENIYDNLTKKFANVLIELPTEDFNTLDFTQTQALIDTGRKAVLEKKEEILEKIL
ncbi:patatin-like phospholipase family protein [Petrotoga mexicana]|uniref:patatin-like phospholipase family protein n=1 Tax=Petrotoga mexicana TaxID=204046 RepID=UPI000CA0882C|nr:patatin-like phospholipase family protein [Petrotoga mexicana]